MLCGFHDYHRMDSKYGRGTNKGFLRCFGKLDFTYSGKLWRMYFKRSHFKLPFKVQPFKAPAAINNYCIQTMAMSSYKTHTSEKGERESDSKQYG